MGSTERVWRVSVRAGLARRASRCGHGARTQTLEKIHMKKHVQLLAFLLVLAAPLGYSAPAAAMTNNCARALTFLESSNAYTNPLYYYNMLYYFTYCEG
jgi:hypothetical protein